MSIILHIPPLTGDCHTYTLQIVKCLVKGHHSHISGKGSTAQNFNKIRPIGKTLFGTVQVQLLVHILYCAYGHVTT